MTEAQSDTVLVQLYGGPLDGAYIRDDRIKSGKARVPMFRKLVRRLLGIEVECHNLTSFLMWRIFEGQAGERQEGIAEYRRGRDGEMQFQVAEYFS